MSEPDKAKDALIILFHDSVSTGGESNIALSPPWHDDFRALTSRRLRSKTYNIGTLNPFDLASEPQVNNSNSMPDDTTDLKIALSAAKTDAKFQELLGEMRTEFGKVGVRLDGLERSASGTKTTIVVTEIAVLALTFAALSYGQAWFGIGVSTRDVVKSAVAEYVQEHPTPSK